MDPTLITILAVAGVLLVGSWILPKLAPGLAEKIGLGGGLDKLTTAVTAALNGVKSAVLLSPLGRSKVCDILVFLEPVIKMFPEGDKKAKALQGREDLLLLFGSAPDEQTQAASTKTVS